MTDRHGSRLFEATGKKNNALIVVRSDYDIEGAFCKALPTLGAEHLGALRDVT